MKYEPSMIPHFISRLEQATSEQEIGEATSEIKSAVVDRWENSNTRRKPMSEIRAAVRERFPAKSGKSIHEGAPFPYYFTNSGKGKIARWEHLAIKHLSEEWNPGNQPETVEPVKVADTEVEVEVVKSNILSEVGLTTDEVAYVKQALGDTAVKEWVKTAILQRANAINRKNEVQSEDLSEVSSEILMKEKKYRSSPVAARELVSRAVRVVKQWNLDHPDQKWCITNKILSELSEVTVKAVAKAVEGMDLVSYNQGQGLEPLGNRFLKTAVGNPSEVMSIELVTGVE